MLQRMTSPAALSADEQWAPQDTDSHVSFDDVLAAVRRRARVLMVACAAALALGTAYIMTEIPLYTAWTDVLVEHRRLKLVEDSYLSNPLAAFDGVVSSEMEVIQSGAVALRVVQSLGLAENPGFTSDALSPTWRFVELVRAQLSATPPAEAGEDARTHPMVAKLKSNLRVQRVGPAFVLRIEYKDADPALAAQIANAYAEAYLRDQLETKFDAMRQASEWLRVRVVDLREKVAQSELAAMRARSGAQNDVALVGLHALEREAQAYRTLHTSFLASYQEAVHQQTYPMADARIITEAAQPHWTSYPRKTIILALSLFVGAAIGGGLGGLFELRDRGFRRSAQVREQLHLNFLGMLPTLRRHWRFFRGKRRPAGDQLAEGERPIQQADDTLRHVLDVPTSSFSESLRNVAIAAELALPDKALRVIGVTSVLPGEGRSVVAKNFASLLAARGARTLLIDADLTNAGLTQALASSAEIGLADIVLSGQKLTDALFYEPETGLAILPARKGRTLPRTGDLISSPGFAALLRDAAESFDHVVIDLPPLARGIDVCAAAMRIDAFVCVVEWARTARKLVRNALTIDQPVWEKCIGVVYNKVDSKRLRRYEGYGIEGNYEDRERTGFRV